MKRRIKFIMNWEPKARREKAWKAFAEMLDPNKKQKNGGNRHGL